MESRYRKKLAQFHATKLLLKMVIDLLSARPDRFKNSLSGWWMTIGCHTQHLLKNRRVVECNICGWQGNRFYPHVTKSRAVPDEKCPRCHSIPRYRLLQYFLINELDFYHERLEVLEVGPNRSLQEILQNNPDFSYVSIDLNAPHAMHHMDVTDLKFKDRSFDFIFCISVMQFVEDDLKGFLEMYRVLRPGGRLVFASGVDITREKTRTFPLPDVRRSYARRTYGRDVSGLIEKAGFKVKVYYPAEHIDEALIKRLCMARDPIYLLTRDR